ncbi:MAG: flagellar filament capping protein FliD [Acidobacteriales bacterium]|nr:flagellar filament capping protein FliD [Terriglobales bacterium]
MSNNSTIFSGSSRYASDFQSVITRAVKIASLPLTQLENVKSTLSDRSSALSSLDSVFSNLSSAIQTLQSSTGTSSYTSTTSTAGVVRATVGDGAMEGTYQIEVTNLGSYSNSMSKDGLTQVSDPATGNIASGNTFTLTVDGVDHELTGFTTLSGLTAAINADTDANVQATIVNLGSTSTPDYRLSLQSKKLGSTSIQLADSESNVLMDTLATGAAASYKVNGSSTVVSSDSRTVTLAPGLTVDLMGASESGKATTITVSRSTLSMQNALSGFATAYNAAMTELDKHRGSADGALAGDSIVSTLQQTLRGIAGYSTGNDGVSSLTALGFSFDKSGRLSFDSSAFTAATGDDYSALSDFLGSNTGGGFLKSATDALDMVSDGDTGILTKTIDNVNDQITRQSTAIGNMEDRITQLELSLNTQMAAADALIAGLEQQVLYIQGLFSAMDTATNSLE